MTKSGLVRRAPDRDAVHAPGAADRAAREAKSQQQRRKLRHGHPSHLRWPIDNSCSRSLIRAGRTKVRPFVISRRAPRSFLTLPRRARCYVRRQSCLHERRDDETSKRFALIVAVGTFAVAVPAAPKPPHPARPGHPPASHECTPHTDAGTASGLLVCWSAAQTSSDRDSGSITIHVTRASQHVAGAGGSDVTYSVTDAKAAVSRGGPPRPPGPSERARQGHL